MPERGDPTEVPDDVAEAFGPGELCEVAELADYLVLACPLTERTRGPVDADVLSWLPEWSVLVEALQSGELRGAALDIAEEPLPGDSPLWDVETVVLTPHVAARRHTTGRAVPTSSRGTTGSSWPASGRR